MNHEDRWKAIEAALKQAKIADFANEVFAGLEPLYFEALPREWHLRHPDTPLSRGQIVAAAVREYTYDPLSEECPQPPRWDYFSS